MKFHGIEKVRQFFKENPKRIVIMRGLPGSGKSTLTAEINSWSEDGAYDAYVCSSDSFFVDNHGVYRFDPKMLPVNHAKCFQKYIEAVRHMSLTTTVAPPSDTIIVDNTNTVFADMIPYCRVAEAYRVPFIIVEILCDPQTSLARNVHGVPIEVIFGMYKNLITDQLPGYLKRVVLQPETKEEQAAREAWVRPTEVSSTYVPEGRDKSGVID